MHGMSQEGAEGSVKMDFAILSPRHRWGAQGQRSPAPVLSISQMGSY